MGLMNYDSYLKEHRTSISRKEILYYNFNQNKQVIVPNKLDLSLIRSDLTQIDYHSSYDKTVLNTQLEHYRMIPFSVVYYNILASTQRIPSIEDYVNTYVNLYCDRIDDMLTFQNWTLLAENITFTFDELQARMLRAYNSFNREVELLVRFYKDTTDEAFYDTVNDAHGIDMLIKYKGKNFWIREAIKTARSESFMGVKNKRHVEDFKQNPYSFPLYMDMCQHDENSLKCGDIFIYPKDVIKTIYEKMDELLVENS